VYFEGESESFDTIFKAWREDFDIYGAGWTQINRDVRDIIGGCHVKCNDLKNAYREHADEIRKIIKALPFSFLNIIFVFFIILILR
jgi:hypothetical protein